MQACKLRRLLQSSEASPSPDPGTQEEGTAEVSNTPATPTPPAPGAGTLSRATNVVFLPPGNTLAKFLPPAPVSPAGKLPLLPLMRQSATADLSEKKRAAGLAPHT